MRKMFVLIAILGVLYYVGNMAINSDGSLPLPASFKEAHDRDVVEARVTAVLAGLQERGSSLSDTAQVAICQWARGAPFISDRAALESAVDSWDRWRRKYDLYTRPLASYEIVGIERVPEQEGNGHVVTLNLSGRRKPVRWNVEEGQPIEWL